MKSIVLTCDRYRALTEHMILQYERLWPDHPFAFRIPYQDIAGKESPTRQYIKSPASIKATVMQLLDDLDDEEWIYWCLDDKYPIQLVVNKIKTLLADLRHAKELSGLLFCRCRETLNNPGLTLHPATLVNSFGDIYLERKTWFQIWIHQFIKVKVIRHLFANMPDNIPNARIMDELKFDVIKPPDFRLFVTQSNFAVFGESTVDGVITQNCFDSISGTDIALPSWFSRSNGRHITMGTL